jgi:uncharacterized protein YycO
MYKRHFFSISAGLAFAIFSPLQGKDAKPFALQDGDIVFSGSAAGQGSAIIAATGSPYTHCGIVFQHEDRWMVLEAVHPVSVATLEAFMARSRKESFTARRLTTAIPPDAYQKARKWAEAQVGREYDVRFGWGDEKLYCSELVWKFYQQAGIELCPPRRFRDYDLQKPEVKKIIEQRYGGMGRLPLDEKVVAPSDLAASTLLIEVPRAK